MEKTAFEKGLDYTFANEGGFSNDKADRGGATKFGITIGDLSKWRRRAVSIQEVRDLSADEAKAIYKAWYWDTLSLDQVRSEGVAICMFDIGVVRGIGVPPKYAQQICNSHGANLVVDGHVGPKTLLAVNALDPALFIRDFASKTKAGFYAIVAGRPSQIVFLKGWINRANRLLTLIPKAVA